MGATLFTKSVHFQLDWCCHRTLHDSKLISFPSFTLSTTAKQRITYIKETTRSTLAKRNLVINESKSEDYEITREGNEKWKKCKLLGSLLDTEKDINRRTILAIDAFKTLNKILDSRKISNAVKIRTFNAYVARVFLYNSELWTLTPKNWKIQSTLSKGDISGKSSAYTGLRKTPTLNGTPKPKLKTQKKTTAHMDGTGQT